MLTLHYVLFSAGYLCFRDETSGMILDNFKTHFGDPFDLMLCLHLILYIPVEFTLTRYSIVKLFQYDEVDGKPLPAFWHVVLTCTLLYSCMVFELLLEAHGLSDGEAFGVILDFTGGVVGSTVSFILPAVLYLDECRSGGDQRYVIMSYLMLVFGLFILIAVPTTSIMALREGSY